MTPIVVLIVDDDDRNRKLARDVLRSAGIETIEARTSAEGVALARSRRPNAVLLDLRLPDADGIVTLRRLRAEPATATIPVVAFTALGHGREWLLEAGFDAYLEKPIDILWLAAEVRRLCTR